VKEILSLPGVKYVT